MHKTVFRLVGAVIVGSLAFVATTMDQSPRLTIGIVVGLPSFMLMIISRRQLGKSFSMMPEARGLVTTGLYTRIQHPMYLFLDLFLVALIVALDWPIALLAWGILVVLQTLQGRPRKRYSRPPLALTTKHTEVERGFR